MSLMNASLLVAALLLGQPAEPAAEEAAPAQTSPRPGFSRAPATFSAGGALVYGTEDGAGLGVRGEFRYVNELVPKLTVGAELVLYSGETIDFSFTGIPFTVTYRLIEVNAVGRYRLFEQEQISAYGLGGLGFAALSANVDSSGTTIPPTVDDQSAVAVHFGGGAEYALTRSVTTFAELRFSIYLGGGSEVGGAELGTNAQLAAGARYYF